MWCWCHLHNPSFANLTQVQAQHRRSCSLFTGVRKRDSEKEWYRGRTVRRRYLASELGTASVAVSPLSPSLGIT